MSDIEMTNPLDEIEKLEEELELAERRIEELEAALSASKPATSDHDKQLIALLQRRLYMAETALTGIALLMSGHNANKVEA